MWPDEMKRPLFCIVSRAATMVLMLVACHNAVRAQEQHTPQSGKAMLLRVAKATNDTQVEIDVVERSSVNKNLYVDLVGLRLWIDNTESQRRLRVMVASPSSALNVVHRLGTKLMENRADYFTCTKRHARPPLADAAAGVSFRCVRPAE